MSPLTHLLVMLMTPLAPIAAALAILLLPKQRVLRAAALLAPLPAIVTSAVLPSGVGATLPWLLEGSELGLDVIGRLLLFASASIWLACTAFALGGAPAERRGRFFVFFLLAMGGNLGAIVAQDMLSFYLFFSLMSFSAYGLVVHDGTRAARRAGAVYIVLVVAGDMMLYAALVPVAFDAGGAVMFDEVREALGRSAHRSMVVALTVAGFGVKAGALGLHVALPLIYRAAPTPAAAALGGAMIHAGVLGWLRFLPLGTELGAWGYALIGIGLAGAFYAAAVGILQRDARHVLAYSSISQVGIMLAGTGAALASPDHAAAITVALTVYALHHAFAKGSLLLGVGVASGAAAHAGARWGVRAGLVLPALTLTGLPPTGGMPAKELLKEAVGAAGTPLTDALAALMPWTALATTLVVARFLWLVWPLSRDGRAEASALGAAAWIVLVACGAGVVWWQPLARLPGLWRPSVLLELVWPVTLGAALAVAAARAAGARPGRIPWIVPGDVVVPVERAARRARARWLAFAHGPLAAGQRRLRDASSARSRQMRWRAAADAIEAALGDFGTAVTLLLVVTLLLLLLSPAGR